jgi:hypothetical protein
MCASRIQTKYGSAGLFVGPTPATGQHFADGNEGVNLVKQLHRVQSFSDSFDVPLEDVLQLGNTAAIDKLSNTSPTPTFDFTYYPTNGINEYRLGFPIDGETSIGSGILDTTNDEKNYFALFTPEGVDAVADTDRANHRVVGIGNGFISSFDISAAVGGFLEANVSVEGSNYITHANSSGNYVPAVNLTDGSENTTWEYAIPVQSSGESAMPTAIKKGGISIEGLPGTDLFGTKINSANLQSFSVSVPFARDALERLGNDFVFARPVQTPINATVSIDFSVSDLATGSLASVFNDCSQKVFDFTINAKACQGGSNSDQMKILVKKAYFESENASMDVGSARNGSISFQVPIGAANQTDAGIFLSGTYAP